MSYNIDLQKIAEELEFDLEDVEMLMDLFLESVEDSMIALKEAIEENNFDKVYQCSHSIKGSSANLTLMDISNKAQDIEHNARESNHIDYLSKFSELKILIDNLN